MEIFKHACKVFMNLHFHFWTVYFCAQIKDNLSVKV